MADQWTAAGFTPDPVANPDAWQAAGFKPDPTTSPDQFAQAPDAAIQRLQDGISTYGSVDPYGNNPNVGKSLSAIVGAAKTGWEQGSDAKGFANTWAGINNATSALSNFNPLKPLAETANAVVKPLDAASHLLSGAVGAAGGAVGQAFGEAIGAGDQAEGFKETATEAIGLGSMMIGAKPGPLLPMKDGRVARMVVDDTTGKVEAEPLGPMPTPQMAADAASTITKDDPKDVPAVEAKVADYWTKQGVHPAEVVEAAQQSPAMARDLSSASTPPMPLPERPSKQWLGELDDRFNSLRGQDQASKLQFQKFVEQLPDSLKNDEVQAKWYAHGEGDPLAPEMSKAEADGYNKYFLPLKQREAEAFEQLKTLRFPAEEMAELDPAYMHRMVQGKSPQIDRYAGEQQEVNPYYGPGLFNRTPSGAKARDYFALENPNGDRQLVRINGKSVTAIQKGQAQLPLKHDLDQDVRLGDHLQIDGADWYVKHAYTREIEENTQNKYYQNALANTIDNTLHLESALRATYEIQRLRSSDEWAQYTSGENATATPSMPMFRNDKMDPRLSNVIDNYWSDLPTEGIPKSLYAINRFAIGSLFWNPLVHGLNVASDWTTARGWDNITPTGFKSLFVDGARAIHEVVTQGPKYQELLRAGNSLELAGLRTKDFYKGLLQRLGSEIVQKPEGWTHVFTDSNLSPIAWGKMWMSGASQSLWAISDMFMMQHVMSLERKGMTTQAAIHEAEKFIANYRMPPDILEQKSVRDVAMNPLLFEFSRYHYSIMKHYGNLANDLVKGTGQGRVNAMGQVTALGAMSMLVGPAISALWDHATGTNAQIGPYGAARYAYPAFEALVQATKSFWPQSVQKYYGDDKSFLGQLESVLALSPVTQVGKAALTNQDYFGRPVVEPAGTKVQQVGQAAEYGTQQLLSPYNSAVQAYRSGMGPGEAITKNLFGLRDRSPEAEERLKKFQKEQASMAKSRVRKPHGPIEGMADELGN